MLDSMADLTGDRRTVRRLHALLVATAAAVGLIALLLGAPAAHSATVHNHVGYFGGTGSTPGLFNGTTMPQRIAVHEASGKLFVADRGNNRVQVFTPTASGADPAFQIAVSGPVGVAIDQDSGDLFVTNATAISKFNPDSATDPTAYTADASFVSPAIGTGPGQVGALQSGLADRPSGGGIAVDPTNGNIVVADVGRNLVQRFTSSGSFVSSFNGCWDGSPSGFCLGILRPAFTGIRDIAIHSNGDVLVADVSGANARVDRFNAAGHLVATLSVNNNPVANPGLATSSLNSSITIGVNPVTDEAFVSSSMSQFALTPQVSRVYHFESNTLVGFFSAPNPPGGFSNNFAGFTYGIASRGTSPGRLYVLASTEPPGGFVTPSPRVQVFAAVTLPTVAFAAPTAITPAAATFSGTVNAQGSDVSWRVRYRPVGATAWLSAPDPAGAVSGTTDVAVQHTVSNLEPNTDYEAKLVANVGSLEVESGVRTFRTLVTPPLVDTSDAAHLEVDAARLLGGVNPRNAATSYHFEWGETTDYGERLPADDVGVGSGGVRVAAAQRLTGLEPGTTYHFRLVAENSEGHVSRGDDRTFTTLTEDFGGLQGERAYELPIRQPIGIVVDARRGIPGADGDAVAFETEALDPHVPWVDAPHRWILNTRGDDAWSSRAFDLPDPHRIVYTSPAHLPELQNVSVAESVIAHDPDDVNGGGIDLYRDVPGEGLEWISRGELHDPESPDPAPVGIAANGDAGLPAAERFSVVIAGPSASAMSYDGSVVVFGSQRRMLESDPNPSSMDTSSGGVRLYRWKAGELTLISVRPDGSAPTGALVSLGTKTAGSPSSPHAVSIDGSRVFWSDGPTIYAWVEGEEPATVGVGSYVDATPDGGRVFYLAGGRLYGYDVDSQTTQDLTGAAQLRGAVATAKSGDRVYYVGDAALAHAEGSPMGLKPVAGGPNLYVTELSEAGEPVRTRFIARLNDATYDPSTWNLLATSRAASASPDGTVLAFGAASSLVGNPTAGRRQLYVYNDIAGSLVCASCPADGSAPVARSVNHGITGAGRDRLDGGGVGDGWQSKEGYNRLVSDDGTVFFNTATPLLAADENQARDVYEYRNGHLRMITSGATNDPGSQLIGASEDGSTVFFTGGGNYDSRDIEPGLIKVWAARVGGGIPHEPVDPGCSGEGCEGPLQRAPDAPNVASDGFVGAGNLDDGGRKAPARVAVLSPKAIKGVAARLRVRISEPGRVSLSGASVRRGSRKAAKAGVYTVRISLTQKARRSLARRGKVSTRVRVVFRARSGGTAARTVGVTFRQKGGRR